MSEHNAPNRNNRGPSRKPGGRPSDRNGNKPGGRPSGRPGGKPGGKPSDKFGDRTFGDRKPSGRPGGRPAGRDGGRDDRGNRSQGRGPRPMGAGRFRNEDSKPRNPNSYKGQYGGQARRLDMIDPARDAAINALADQCRREPDLALDPLDDRSLEPNDAAFAHAIVDAATRRWLTIRYFVEQHAIMPWLKMHPGVRGCLLAGAAQILFLDRVPPHAAVNSSVEWAKQKVSQKSGGMVNAVLRRIVELSDAENRVHATERPAYVDEQDALPLDDGTMIRIVGEKILPEDPLERLSVATSHPIELLRHWIGFMKLREVREVAMHSLCRPPVILNTAHATEPLTIGCQPHTVPGHHIWTGTHAELHELLKTRQDIWVQDPGSTLAVSSVTDLNPKLVIDTCAGLGTKTRQLAAAFPNAQIIATDIDQPRYATLERVFGESEQVKVVPHESLLDFAGEADLVLIDAPCSNTAVLARRVEARYRFTNKRQQGLVDTQRQLIADAIPLLRAQGAGQLLYSTCSLSAEENEEIARWAGRWHAFEAVREHRRHPAGAPGQGPEHYTDGSFATLLK